MRDTFDLALNHGFLNSKMSFARELFFAIRSKISDAFLSEVFVGHDDVESYRSKDMAEYEPMGPDEYLEHLIMMYGDALFANAKRLTHNPEDARDLCQDTFERAYIALKKETEPWVEKPLNWLYTIERHIFLNSLRKRGDPVEQASNANGEGLLNQLPCVSISEQFGFLSSIEDSFNSRPEAIAECNETREEIYNLIKALPQSARKTMFLYLFRELSHPEIANQLCRPLGTIKSRVHSSRARLQELLISQDHEEI